MVLRSGFSTFLLVTPSTPTLSEHPPLSVAEVRNTVCGSQH